VKTNTELVNSSAFVDDKLSRLTYLFFRHFPLNLITHQKICLSTPAQILDL